MVTKTNDQPSVEKSEDSNPLVQKNIQIISIEEAYQRAGGHGIYQFMLAFATNVGFITTMIYILATPFFLKDPELECSIKDQEGNYGNYSICTVERACEDGVKHRFTGNVDSTYITEYNLICGDINKMLTGFIGTGFFLGNLIGNLFFSQLADIIGRTIVGGIGIIGNIVLLLLLTLVSYNIYVVIVLSSILGFVLGGDGIPMFSLMIESSPQKYVTLHGTLFNTLFAVFEIFIAGIMYAQITWRDECYIGLGFSALYLLVIYWIRDSPRYYSGKKQFTIAKQRLQRISQINRAKNFPSPETFVLSEEQEDSKSLTLKSQKKYTLIDVFKFGSLRCKFLLLGPMYIISAFVYYGISLDLPHLAGNIYLNGFISGLAETLACIFSGILASKFGRKKVNIFMYGISGIACIGYYLVEKYSHNFAGELILLLFGKFGISAAYNVIYLFSTELFPTVIKNAAHGSLVFLSRIGSILAPMVDAFMNPILIFGILSFIPALLTFGLPETLGRQLEDQIEEVRSYSTQSSIVSLDSEKEGINDTATLTIN